MQRQWWQEAVFYQIYPRSFADSNGDGIGDLDGITARLDYLNDGTENSLGIDAIWLNPFYPSPNRDWGYDVSDYCGVHPDYGDLAAFDRLIAEAHRRNIRVIVDFVPNHTSDQHPWFLESRSSRVNPKRDWYLWVAGDMHRLPNNWLSSFGGPAWQYDSNTRAYYLHLFLPEQPDLNYRNPQVRAQMHEVMRFWLDRGADGFRVDVISSLMKDSSLRDNPTRRDVSAASLRDPYRVQLHNYDQDRPEVHEVIRGFRSVLDKYQDRMMVGEVFPREQHELADYLRPDELQLAFNFHFLRRKWEASAFRDAIDAAEKIHGTGCWPTYTLSNHDVSRHITRYANGRDDEDRARAAAVMLMTLHGTPFIYYGEEIGMRDVGIPSSHRHDPVGRDGYRTPMQWTADENAGFTTGIPWLPVGDYSVRNVERQKRDPNSTWNLYRKLIRLRRETPALIEGRYRVFAPPPDDCLVFYREAARQRVMVALNFASEARHIVCPPAKLLLSTHPNRLREMMNNGIRLTANEAVIAELAP
jgi:alpha-glucosidase